MLKVLGSIPRTKNLNQTNQPTKTPTLIVFRSKTPKDTWLLLVNTILNCFLLYIRTVEMTVAAASSLRLQNRHLEKVIWITFQNNPQHRSTMQSKNTKGLFSIYIIQCFETSQQCIGQLNTFLSQFVKYIDKTTKYLKDVLFV